MTGATYRQLDYWWRNGYFGGDTGEGLGSGRQRVWTGREQRIAELMVRLGRAGIEKASVAARIARDGVDGNVRSVTTEDGIAIAWRRIV